MKEGKAEKQEKRSKGRWTGKEVEKKREMKDKG
jgi:hypothetical protein